MNRRNFFRIAAVVPATVALEAKPDVIVLENGDVLRRKMLNNTTVYMRGPATIDGCDFVDCYVIAEPQVRHAWIGNCRFRFSRLRFISNRFLARIGVKV